MSGLVRLQHPKQIRLRHDAPRLLLKVEGFEVQVPAQTPWFTSQKTCVFRGGGGGKSRNPKKNTGVRATTWFLAPFRGHPDLVLGVGQLFQLQEVAKKDADTRFVGSVFLFLAGQSTHELEPCSSCSQVEVSTTTIGTLCGLPWRRELLKPDRASGRKGLFIGHRAINRPHSWWV